MPLFFSLPFKSRCFPPRTISSSEALLGYVYWWGGKASVFYPVHAILFFHLVSSCNTNAAESRSFFHCSSSTSHPCDVVGLSLSCSQGLRSGAVLLMLGSPADKGLASGCKCCDALICECALLPQEVSLVCVALGTAWPTLQHRRPASHGHVKQHLQTPHQQSAGSLHGSHPLTHNWQDLTETVVQNSL